MNYAASLMVASLHSACSSTLGQKQTCAVQKGMFRQVLKADIALYSIT